MTNTDSYEADVPIPNLAEGYTRHWGHEEEGPGARPAAGAPARRSNIYTRPARGSAAGGGYSTAEDMLRFANALTANKLLSPAYTEWVLTGIEPGAADAPKPSAYREAPAGGPQRKAQIGPVSRGQRGGLGIAGGAPGINAALEIDLETGYVVIVMANYDPPAAVNIAKKARRLLTAVKPEAGAR